MGKGAGAIGTRAAGRAAERAASPAKATAAQTPRESVLAALHAEVRSAPSEGIWMVRDVRARSPLGKEEFDAAALDLARRGELILHYHDLPFGRGVTAAQRNAMIYDPRPNLYFHAIAPGRRH